MTFVHYDYTFNKKQIRELCYQRTRTKNLIKTHERRTAELKEKLEKIEAQLKALTPA